MLVEYPQTHGNMSFQTQKYARFQFHELYTIMKSKSPEVTFTHQPFILCWVENDSSF